MLFEPMTKKKYDAKAKVYGRKMERKWDRFSSFNTKKILVKKRKVDRYTNHFWFILKDISYHIKGNYLPLTRISLSVEKKITAYPQDNIKWNGTIPKSPYIALITAV